MKDFSCLNPNRAFLIMGTTNTVMRMHRIIIGKHIKILTNFYSVYIFSKDTSINKKKFDPTIICEGYSFINNNFKN